MPATTSRGPTRIVTPSAPHCPTSQRAAIRVPLPDSSAVEPSGFQITISACAPSTETTSRIPSDPPTSARTRSGVSGSPSSARSASRYSLPAARQRENFIRHLVRRPVGSHANEAGDPAHPLALVGGEAARPRRQLRNRLVSGQVRDLTQAHDLAGGRRQRPGERSSHLFLHPSVEHRARPFLDAPVELCHRDVE